MQQKEGGAVKVTLCDAVKTSKISIKKYSLRDVAVAVPKIRETRVVYVLYDKDYDIQQCQKIKRLWHTTIIPCVTPHLHLFLIWGYSRYYCCVPYPFVLWHIYHHTLSAFWHCHSYILQHFDENFYI